MAGGEHYDYIIVGAGSAGCLLANRLTEDGNSRVLLLEAGGEDKDPLIHIPIGLGQIHKHRSHDWKYDTEAEPGLQNREIEAMRGKVLGGSSSINVMAYTRGDPNDYNRWERNGATGWSYKDNLPYFKKSETWEGGQNTWRGGSGELFTEMGHGKDSISDAWLAAGKSAGYPATDDFNGASHEGFGRIQYTIHKGKRWSSASAFLRPALKRSNLTLEINALTTRVLLNGTKATGIEYTKHGQTHQVHADREVILSAGAFNTPQILMLSGIGHADHLKDMGIDLVADLPVGDNLQDHIAAWFNWFRSEPGEFYKLLRFDRIAMAMAQNYFFGTGPADSLPGAVFRVDTLLERFPLDEPEGEWMRQAIRRRG